MKKELSLIFLIIISLSSLSFVYAETSAEILPLKEVVVANYWPSPDPIGSYCQALYTANDLEDLITDLSSQSSSYDYGYYLKGNPTVRYRIEALKNQLNFGLYGPEAAKEWCGGACVECAYSTAPSFYCKYLPPGFTSSSSLPQQCPTGWYCDGFGKCISGKCTESSKPNEVIYTEGGVKKSICCPSNVKEVVIESGVAKCKICGNGVVDSGETCDCGASSAAGYTECIKTCDMSTCKKKCIIKEVYWEGSKGEKITEKKSGEETRLVVKTENCKNEADEVAHFKIISKKNGEAIEYGYVSVSNDESSTSWKATTILPGEKVTKEIDQPLNIYYFESYLESSPNNKKSSGDLKVYVDSCFMYDDKPNDCKKCERTIEGGSWPLLGHMYLGSYILVPDKYDCPQCYKCMYCSRSAVGTIPNLLWPFGGSLDFKKYPEDGVTCNSGNGVMGVCSNGLCIQKESYPVTRCKTYADCPKVCLSQSSYKTFNCDSRNCNYNSPKIVNIAKFPNQICQNGKLRTLKYSQLLTRVGDNILNQITDFVKTPGMNGVKVTLVDLNGNLRPLSEISVVGARIQILGGLPDCSKLT